METTYEDFLKANKYSNKTIKLYLTYENLAGQLEDNQESIDKFIREHNHGLARAFLRSYLYDYLELTHLKIPKFKGRKRRRLPKYVSIREYKILKNDPQMRFSVKLFIRTLFETGLRREEAVSLTPVNIDFDTREIRGIGKGNVPYIVNIKKKTASMFKQIIDNNGIQPKERIFPFGAHRSWELITKESERILGRHISPHQFRHGIATYLLNIGWNLPEIQEYGRWKNLETVGIYTHLSRKKVKQKLKESGY